MVSLSSFGLDFDFDLNTNRWINNLKPMNGEVKGKGRKRTEKERKGIKLNQGDERKVPYFPNTHGTLAQIKW